MIGEETMCVGADLGRDKISSLVLTEPVRDPELYGFAQSGWKLAGTAVKGGGTMKTRYKLAAVHNQEKARKKRTTRNRGQKKK